MKKILCSMSVLLLVILFFPMQMVWADTGPKPSVQVQIKGMSGEPYYVTLLSKTEKSGPWDSEDSYHEWSGQIKIWKKFHDYQDINGYKFLGYFEECSNTNTFTWSYYAPDEFKFLIYLPEEDRMICSEQSYQRTTFHTYYTITLDGNRSIQSGQVTHTYDWTHEVTSLLFRVFLTIVIELGLAWYIGYRKKKQMVGIIFTNVVTQGILNMLLNLIMLQRGETAFKLYYFVLECVVFLIEGLIYRQILVDRSQEIIDRSGIWWYTFIANVVSFIAGVFLSMVIPNMFI